MGFTTETTIEKCFESLGEIYQYAAIEHENLVRVPRKTFLDRNAHFMDDQYWGDGSEKVRFNKDGFAALCRLAGVPSLLLQDLEREGLATNLLNDRLRKK